MVKAIKWQIPFASLSGTLYRIDIYAENDGTWDTAHPIQLTAGESPFVTEEDSSEDFFAPIRTQTGSIQVCTCKPDGTMLTLDEILPANNIDHPVRLLNISDPSNPVIEWQGFLSCEAYSQSYTSIPENISIPIISVLEAMRSMYIETEDIEPLGTIGCLMARVLNNLSHNYNGFNRFFFPKRSWDIFKKSINSSVFLAKEEYQNMDRVSYQLEGISLSDIIEKICTFMGWVAREQEDDLYFQEQGGDGEMFEIYVPTLISDDDIDEELLFDYKSTSIEMSSDLQWMGADHKETVLQGAHSVMVSAKLEKFDIGADVPALPYGDLFAPNYIRIGNTYVYTLPSADDDAYSNLKFHTYRADIQITDTDVIIGTYTPATNSETITYSLPYAGNTSPAYDSYLDRGESYTNFAGAFLARMQFDDYQSPDYQHSQARDGLYISLFGGAWKENTVYNRPIFQMRGVQVFAAFENGYINISASVRAFLNSLAVQNPFDYTKLMINLQIGNKAWNGTQWVTASPNSYYPFWVGFDNEGNIESNWNDQMGIDQVKGLLLPVDETFTGEIVLNIFPETKKHTYGSGISRSMVYGMFFAGLSVSFIPKKDNQRTDRSNNTYYMRLETNFRDDDIKIETELASWLHNSPSPSLLFNSDGTPMQTLQYTEGNQTNNRRPELDLMNRMGAYYEASRRSLELVTKHPTSAALPMLSINGINPDTRRYLPLAESRDWRTGVCKLTCFETPQ